MESQARGRRPKGIEDDGRDLASVRGFSARARLGRDQRQVHGRLEDADRRIKRAQLVRQTCALGFVGDELAGDLGALGDEAVQEVGVFGVGWYCGVDHPQNVKRSGT